MMGVSCFTYSLRVDLADVGQALGQCIGRHLVSKLVSEFGSLALCSLGKSSSIGNRSRDNAADRGRDFENVSNGGWVDQFILRAD